MDPIALYTTIICGLIVLGLAGWVTKSRIFVLVSKLFTYSHLTDKGQLVEITVFNRGIKTEEDIEVTFSNTIKLDVVGMNNQDIRLEANKCTIHRIGPSDEATILFLAEGTPFGKKEIVSCISKNVNGKIVDKLEDVTPIAPQRIGIIIFSQLLFLRLRFLYILSQIILITSTKTMHHKFHPCKTC